MSDQPQTRCPRARAAAARHPVPRRPGRPPEPPEPPRRLPGRPLAPLLSLSVLSVPLLVLLLSAAGCQRDAGGGFAVPFSPPGEPVSEDELEVLGIRFAQPPRVAELTIDQERRPVLLSTPAGWTWRGRLPAEARLAVGVVPLPEELARSRRFVARIALRHAGERRVLETLTVEPSDRPLWHDTTLDLSAWSGEQVTLELSASFAGRRPAAGEGGEEPVAEQAGELDVAWGPVTLSGRGTRRADSRPDVLLVVVDTLRADHLGTYGYQRATSPRIDTLLAGRGAMMEDAYSQAPWTLPSVISYLTGRYPGELVRGGIDEVAVPEAVPTLAERLHQAGYRTAAFIANPTVHAGIGFARGFDSFYVAPPELASLSLHADSINRRVLPWLEANGDRPFFLYVHYLDPHDPYDNSEIVDGRSPFLPGYDGPIRGDMVHGVYVGQVELPDPQRDRAQLTALYDSEIHYVDGAIGELLAALDPGTLRRTLIALTADHGEELGDHGGWKHGQTLYNEQIHVPLLFRWDGRIPAGRRLSGSVRLVDLVPTVLSAVGIEIPRDLAGVDLLPALVGMETLPRRPAVAEHLSFGPLRAAAVLDDWKLVLFNEREPFTPRDALQAAIYPRDLERLQRAELYDLSQDPGEQHNLAAVEPRRIEQLEPVVQGQLDGELPGLRLMLDAVGVGRHLRGRVVFERPPAGWEPYFLGEADRVELAGRELRFELVGDPLQKGVRVLGEIGGIVSISARIGDSPVPPRRILLGRGDPYGGGTVAAARLLSRDWPLLASVPLSPALRIWRREPPVAAPAGEQETAETRQRLRSLGYLQ